MQGRIVLVTNDSDFYEFITPKLKLRKSDELFKFKFDEIPEKLHLLKTSVIIIDSECSKNQTLELLKMLKNNPALVFAFNEDNDFKINCLKNGALYFFTPINDTKEIETLLASALNITSILTKNYQYREILEKQNLISANNEILLDYSSVIENELDKINKTSTPAVLAAIAPNDKTKFIIKPNQIETIILNNIRKNDILMNYATNKYFLLLFDTDLKGAQKIWNKIQQQMPHKIYAGFAKAFCKNRQQIINEALNKLHEAINYEKFSETMESQLLQEKNFKLLRQNFNKKFEQVILPSFYHIKQKYNDKLYGVVIEIENGEGFGIIRIKNKQELAVFKITCPGFSKINIDINFFSKKNDVRRISLDPDELDIGLLESLLEQFMLEFKKEN